MPKLLISIDVGDRQQALAFYVDDIDTTLQRIADSHGICEQEGNSGYRWALCADPFGNGFCLIQEQAKDR